MPGKAKTLLVWLVIAFLLYAVVTKPDRAADVIHNIGDFIGNLFDGISSFFSSLAN
jgi:hypothetical protein